MVIYILIGVAALAAVICLPLGLIWSLNTLFGLALAYSFQTWAAALFFVLLLGSVSRG